MHLNSWLSTYKNIIPQSYLSSLTLEKRIKTWETNFNLLDQNYFILVVEDKLGEIIGFADGGRNREIDNGYEGELYAIYLLEEYKGKGIGKRLFHEAVNKLKSKRLNTFMVWVLEANPAIGFYSKLGGKEFTRRDTRIANEFLTEVGIGWINIEHIQ